MIGRARLISLALSLVAVGCRETAPSLETWPVHGTVIDQNGKTLTNGAVRLMTDEDPQLITVGKISADGKFMMRSQRSGHFYEGAVPRSYGVLVLTAKTQPDGTLSPIQFHAPEPYVVKAESNTLELKISL
jgi:hypothetical protein